MKKLLVALLALVVILLAAIVVAPSFIDWNRYKGDVAAAVRDATGRELAIDGDLKLAILPTPHLSATDLRLASFDGAESPDMVRLAALNLQVAVGPLLQGRLAVTSMELIEPVIVLEESADGRASWRFTPPGAPAAPIAKDGTPGSPLAISAQRITVENGTLIWRGPQAADPVRLEALDAEGSMAGPQGPFSLSATARRGDLPVAVMARTGTLREGQPLPVLFDLELAEGVAALTLSADADTQAQTARGKLKITGPDAAALAATLTGRPAAVPARDFAIETTALLTPESASFANMQVRLGKTAGEASLKADFGDVPEIEGNLWIRNFDLDDWLRETGKAALDSGAGKSAKPKSAVAAGLPKGVAGRFQLSVDALRYRGGLVRNAVLTAGLSEGVLNVTRAAAQLPGGTNVSLNGAARDHEGALRFEGDLAATSDNLRAVLDWLNVDGGALPADRLRSFSWTSRVSVQPKTVSFSRITGKIDATRIGGGITVARRARSSFGLLLELDRVNLDNYLPEPAGKTGGAGGKDNAADKGQGIPVLGDFDANVKLTAGSVTWRGVAMDRVLLEAQLFKGNANIRKATIGDLAGAAASATGEIADLPGTPKPALDVNIDGRDPERFLRLIGLSDSLNGRALGRFKLAARTSGTLAALSVSARLEAMKGVFTGSGRLTGLRDAPAWDFKMHADAPDGERLLALAGLERKATGGGLGPVKAGFRLAGNAKALRVTDLEATVAGAPVKGIVTVGLAAERPKVDADLAAGAVSLDRLMGEEPKQGAVAAPKRPGGERWSRQKIDLSALRGFDMNLNLRADALQRGDIRLDRATVQAALTDGELTVRRLAGTAFGGPVEASGVLNAKTAVPQANGKISGRDLDGYGALRTLAEFERLEGPVSVDFDIRAVGDSEFALISSLAGSGRVTGKVRARLTGEERTQAGVAGIVGVLLGDKVKEFGRASDAMGALLRAFADAPADLSGDIAITKGLVRTENLALDGRGARALTKGVANLPGWTIDSMTTLRRDGDGPDPYMTVRLTGRLDEPNVKTGGTWLRGQPSVQQDPLQLVPTPSKQEQPPEQPKPPKPEQLFLDILKGLSR